MPEAVSTVLSCKCSFCGFALYPHEIAAQLDGGYVDFEKRRTGCMTGIVLCSECWGIWREHAEEPMSKAVARRRAAEKQWTKDMEDNGCPAE